MSHVMQGLFGERSVTKVAGLFEQKAQAEAAMQQLFRAGALQAGQVRLLGPEDAQMSRQEIFGRSLEPENRGIARTMVQTHMVGGLAGAALGVAIYAWFFRTAHPTIVSTPVMSFLAIVGFSIVLGLMLGGLVTIRPDHVRLITSVRSALRHNQWAVVTHPTSAEQTERVRTLLQGGNALEVLSTL